MSAFVRAELASRRRWLAGLALGAFTFLVILGLSYHSIGLGALGQALAGRNRPKAFEAFSGSRHGEVLTPHGWLAFGFNHPLYLILTLAVAIGIGTASVAGEVESGRAELIFTRPIPRRRFLWSSLAIWGAAELFVIAAALAGAFAGGELSADLRRAGLGSIVLAPLQYLPLAFFIAAVAFLASTLSRTRGRALGAAIAVTVLAYLINFTATLFDGLSWARWLSPFGYYDPFAAVDHGIHWGDAAVLTGAAGILILAAMRVIDRRDLA
jgi:ABC-2 type transport system permease protein